MENNKPKHTPGPWAYFYNEKGSYTIHTSREDEGDEKTLGFTRFEADAKLKAAAPELLEALQELQTHLANADLMEYLTDGVAYKMRAAINKATD